MLISCKECGAEISSRAKICPKCGCPTAEKSKSAASSLTLGIISMVYGLGSCVNDFFTENTQATVLPAIFIMAALAVIFGIIAVRKTKAKQKPLWGMILGAAAIVISAAGHLFL